MNNPEVRKRLERIFRDVFEDEHLELTDSLSRDDVKSWDSLGHIRLISAVEDAFGVTFTIEEIDAIKSAGQLVEKAAQHAG